MLKIKLFYFWNIFMTLGMAWPRGCSRRDITELEKELGFSLPKTYKQYLRWMGTDYNGIFRGTDCFISDVERNTSALPELFEENNLTFNLAEHYVCFYMHQGYIAFWFNLPKENDDPTCYGFAEGSMPEPKLAGNFTEFLLQEMQGLAKIIKEYNL
jgi:hypothetical protein